MGNRGVTPSTTSSITRMDGRRGLRIESRAENIGGESTALLRPSGRSAG